METHPKTEEKVIKTGVQYRSAFFERDQVNTEERTANLSFSSEEPYERAFGVEILDHDPGSIRMEFLKSGRAPVLFQHNPSDVVGVVEKASISEGRTGRAKVRFGSSERAETLFRDVQDGIITNVSVGYVTHRAVDTGARSEDGIPVLRVTDWEPLELSLVSIPADRTVGIGRNAELADREVETHIEYVLPAETPAREEKTNTNTEEVSLMTEETTETPAVDTEKVTIEVRDREVARIKELATLGAKHDCREKAEEFMQKGRTPGNLREWILDNPTAKDSAPIQTPVENDLSKKERSDYSVIKIVNALTTRDFSKLGVERDVSNEIAKRQGRDPRGLFLAPNLMVRDLTTSNGGGSNIVGTDHRSDLFIEMLRNRSAVLRLGAKVLGGLVGDVDMPSQTAGATAYWIDNESADTTESNPTLSKVNLSPKTVSARVDVTRKMLLQSDPSVDALLQDDLINIIALAVDSASINGGGSGQPDGIISTVSGTAAQYVTTGSNLLTYGDMVSFESKCASQNADVGTLAYLTTPEVRGRLKQVSRFSSTDTPVWQEGGQPGEGIVNGYRAFASNQVGKDFGAGSDHGIIFGNFADLLIGEWGAVDLFVDPYTNGDRGGHVLRVFYDVDCALRHEKSFVVSTDADPDATS